PGAVMPGVAWPARMGPRIVPLPRLVPPPPPPAPIKPKGQGGAAAPMPGKVQVAAAPPAGLPAPPAAPPAVLPPPQIRAIPLRLAVPGAIGPVPFPEDTASGTIVLKAADKPRALPTCYAGSVRVRALESRLSGGTIQVTLEAVAEPRLKGWTVDAEGSPK